MPDILIISFDFELGWGVLDSDKWRCRESQGVYERMREDIPKLILKLNTFQIKSTWGVVSNMLIDNINKLDIEHLPDTYKSELLDFYQNSRVSTRNGLGLFERLLAMDELCEIASHSTSHLYATYNGVTHEQLLKDAVNSFSTLNMLTNRPVKSFIFPRDESDIRIKLAQAKPHINMRLNPSFIQNSNKYGRTIFGLMNFIKKVPPSSVILAGEDEVYQTGSMHFNAIGGKYKKVRTLLLKTRIEKMLKQIETGRENNLYHIWLHPFNLSESEINKNYFYNFLERIVALRDKGNLDILTMEDIGSNTFQ